MLMSKEVDDALHKRSFSRLVTGASMVYVAIGLLAVGAAFFLSGGRYDRGLQGAPREELSAEQRALIEARIAGGEDPALTDAQKSAIEARIASDENPPLSAEQQAVIEARMNTNQ